MHFDAIFLQNIFWYKETINNNSVAGKLVLYLLLRNVRAKKRTYCDFNFLNSQSLLIVLLVILLGKCYSNLDFKTE